MKRISSLFALGLLSLGLVTSAQAQTKTSQLIITNTTGTTKISQMTCGLDIDNKIVIHSPTVKENTVTLLVPNTTGMGNADFWFPSSGGTLLTNSTTDLNGNAIIAAINAGTTTINASRLDLTGLSAGVSSVAAGDPSLTISTTNNDVTATLNTANPNTWTGVQTLPINPTQGDNLIAAINAANPLSLLTNYVTTSTLNNYSTTAEMNAAIASAVASPITVSAPLTKTGANIGLSTTSSAGTYTNATVTVDNYGRVTSASNGITVSGISGLVAGKISVVKSAGGSGKVADGTITNAAIGANSQILVSCGLDANSTQEQYTASLVSVNATTHQMVVRAQRNGGGVMSSGEGCTISYLIINP